MYQQAGITFTKKMELGQGIGYLTIETNDSKHIQYELNYSAEQPMHKRFTIYTEDSGTNLSKYLSQWDLERLNEAYFNFKTSQVLHTYLNVQMQACEMLCMETLAV